MAARVGTCANASLVAAQLLRIRESWPQEIWARTGRVQLASAFLGSLIAGKWMSMNEAEACATGMWVHGANPNVVSSPGQGNVQGYWDEGVLDIVGGSREEGRRVRGWLGDVDVSGGGRRAGNISRYLVERYGFDPGKSMTLIECLVPANIFDVRYHCDTIHVRFPFFLSIPMSLCERCGFIFWANGYLAYTSTTLYPYKTV
jgi:hypothetical protein